MPAAAPECPYAVYLADTSGAFHLLVFDLDAGRGDVGPDLGRLLRLLDEAGLEHIVAASGPHGGRHVWLMLAEATPAVLVAAIGRAAARALPTLDRGMLCNPVSGAVRPIGAPHRDGGRSELVWPLDPAEADRVLRRGDCGPAPANTIEGLQRLAVLLGVDPLHLEEHRGGAGGQPRVRVVERGPDAPCLPGAPRQLDERVRALLADPPSDDASAHLMRVLVRLAVARWTWPMVRGLLEEPAYARGGLLHAVTRRGGGLRLALSPDRARARLRRQWARAVSYAARLPAPEVSAVWQERRGPVVELVSALQAEADAGPARWAILSGPADRAVLDLLCVLCLRAAAGEVDLDIRRAALATGFGRETCRRALWRLVWDGWIEVVRAAEGTRAARWRLLRHPPQRAGALPRQAPADPPAITGPEPPPVPAAGPRHPRVPLGASAQVGTGGSQGIPPLLGAGGLLSVLERRLGVVSADVFAAPGLKGLGHHAGRTFAAVVQVCGWLPCAGGGAGEGPAVASAWLGGDGVRLAGLSRDPADGGHGGAEPSGASARLDVLVEVTGYRVATVRGHLRQLGAHGLVELAGTEEEAYTPGWGTPAGAASWLGCHGVGADRARRYAVEREVWAWWCAEHAWMTRPKAGLRAGPRVGDDQGELVLVGVPRPRRRYPRGAGGRGDHAAAARLVAAAA